MVHWWQSQPRMCPASRDIMMISGKRRGSVDYLIVLSSSFFGNFTLVLLEEFRIALPEGKRNFFFFFLMKKCDRVRAERMLTKKKSPYHVFVNNNQNNDDKDLMWQQFSSYMRSPFQRGGYFLDALVGKLSLNQKCYFSFFFLFFFFKKK